MANITVVDREGTERTVEASSGLTVMEILRANGFDELIALCGGSCSCATCHVHIDPAHVDKLGLVSEDEDSLLSSSDHRNDYSRLSCQIPFDAKMDGIRIIIAAED